MGLTKFCAHHGIVPPTHKCGRWANGGTHAWRKQRARILERDPFCWCGQPSTEVHHLTPGFDIVVADDELQGVCHKHNPRGGGT